MPMGPIIGGHGPIGAMCPMDMLPMAMLLPGGGGGDSSSTNVVRVYKLYTNDVWYILDMCVAMPSLKTIYLPVAKYLF